MREKERKAVYQFINVVDSLASFHVRFCEMVYFLWIFWPFTIFKYVELY